MRLRIATQYVDRLAACNEAIRFQENVTSPGHARHLFVIRVPLKNMAIGRNDLLVELRARNIGASIHYAPLHTLPHYQPYVRASLPNVEQLMNDIMTLPIGPRVTGEDVTYVTDQVSERIEAARK